MMLDILAIVIVLIFGFLGYLSGFQMQAMRFFVLVGSYFLAGAVGSPLGGWIATKFGFHIVLAQAMATFGAFLFVYLVFSTIGWTILRAVQRASGYFPGQHLALWDACCGALFGGLKAITFIYISLCLLVLVDEPIENKLVSSGIGYDQSRFVAFARTNNLIAKLDLPVVGNLEALVHLSSDPDLRRKLAHDPKVRALFEHPKMRKLLNDPEITAASRSHDLAGLAQNQHLGDALRDPDIRKLLEEIDLSKIMKGPP